MRRFIELLDHVRHHGVTGFRSDNFETAVAPASPATLNYLAECRVFVFSSNDVTPLNLDMDEYIKKVDDLRTHPTALLGPQRDDTIDAPFRVFSIEIAGDDPMGIYQVAPDEAVFQADMFKSYQLCLVVIEVKPKTYKFLSYEESEAGRRVFGSSGELATTKFYLDRLSKEKLGLESVRVKTTIGGGKDKRPHRINEVIHVRPKTQAVGGSGTREIDWSHRFEVRGHWRACSGIGKDRAGMYCVNNFTWVSEHVRGPEHLPLIKKTRLVD